MDVYVGLTDWDWLSFLQHHDMAEVNFRKPSGQPFRALSEGDLFLYKIKAARGGRIAGGGFFVSSTITSIVSEKTFRGQDASALVGEVELRLRGGRAIAGADGSATPEAPSGVTPGTAVHRIGQGAFRTLVADAHRRRCAITGERTAPVLQAARIKSFSSDGPNAVDNGILLRSDMHALFGAGYLAIEYDSRSESRVLMSCHCAGPLPDRKSSPAQNPGEPCCVDVSGFRPIAACHGHFPPCA